MKVTKHWLVPAALSLTALFAPAPPAQALQNYDHDPMVITIGLQPNGPIQIKRGKSQLRRRVRPYKGSATTKYHASRTVALANPLNAVSAGKDFPVTVVINDVSGASTVVLGLFKDPNHINGDFRVQKVNASYYSYSLSPPSQPNTTTLTYNFYINPAALGGSDHKKFYIVALYTETDAQGHKTYQDCIQTVNVQP